MTEDETTSARRLAEAAAALLHSRERKSLRALVRAERHTLALARVAIEPHVERASIAIAHAPANDRTRVALATVRRAAPRVQQALEGALVDARGNARTAARKSLEHTAAVMAPTPLSGRDEHDAAAAHSAASAWSAAWATAATAIVLSEEDPSRAPVAAARARTGSLERIAATETSSAFNDERRRAYEDLGASSVAPELVKVWCALLDRTTCAFCFGKDGQVRGLAQTFGSVPPVHPNCRCIVELLRVPRPERLADIGVDYDTFKRELRDVIRERRENHEGGRHAKAFISDSMGARRSPEVLTARFRQLG